MPPLMLSDDEALARLPASVAIVEELPSAGGADPETQR